MNADGIIGANEDILSYNLYAYVSNNPINMIEPTGEIALVDDMVILGVGLLLSYAIIKITPSFVSGVQGIVANVNSLTGTKSSSKVKKDKNNTINSNSVYTLNDENGVRYVGRTTQIQQTINRHNSNPARTGLSLNVVGSNLSKTQARGLEQMLIMQCRTLNKDNPKNNQINGVSPYNPNYSVYWDAARLWSSENLTPCR